MRITPDPQARKAAEALGRIGHPGAVPALVEVMMPARGGRLGERASDLAAAEALGRIGDPSAADSLIEVLGGDPGCVGGSRRFPGPSGRRPRHPSPAGLPAILRANFCPQLRIGAEGTWETLRPSLSSAGTCLAALPPVARYGAAIAIGCLGSPEEGDADLLARALGGDEILAQCAAEGLALLDVDTGPSPSRELDDECDG